MRIYVISDTHNNTNNINIFAEKFTDGDAVIHLGDVIGDVHYLKKKIATPIYYVKGNCDYSNDSIEEIINIAGKKILLTHGHRYRVKESNQLLLYRAREAEVDIALYGHSHCGDIDYSYGIFLINPGSLSLPRGSKVPTLARIDINNGNIDPLILNLF